LREGILASQRVDDFSLEVYETSARIAVYCQEDKALASVFGRLVPDLYEEHEEASIVTSLSNLKTSSNTTETNGTATRTSNREEYTAVYLLHLLYTAYPSQREFLSRFKALLPHTSPDFPLLAAASTHVRRGDFWALSQLVLHSQSSRSDLIQRMLVAILARTRLRTWATLHAAYMQLQLDKRGWLRSALGFENSSSVEQFMLERAKQAEVVAKEGNEPTWAVNKTAKVKV